MFVLLFQKTFPYVATNNAECSFTPLKITLKEGARFIGPNKEVVQKRFIN